MWPYRRYTIFIKLFGIAYVEYTGTFRISTNFIDSEWQTLYIILNILNKNSGLLNYFIYFWIGNNM